MRKSVIRLFLSIVLMLLTLFIPQPVQLPKRIVQLGYPFHFYTLDFSGNRGGTSMSGAPDGALELQNFNITSSWEEFGQIDWFYLFLSYSVIFIGLMIIEKYVLLKN